jgi:hypothetical protein
MTRRPNGSIEGALDAVQTWMQETKRVVEKLRAEVEQLRRERIELYAQLRFATEQANREVIEAAKLQQKLDSIPSIEPLEPDDFDVETSTDIEPIRCISLLRGDSTEKTVST